MIKEPASTRRLQPQFCNLDQPLACTSLIPDIQHMWGFEHQSQASTSVVTPPDFIAQLDSVAPVSSKQASRGILVDTGAAISVAPKSFASDIELSPVPSTLQLTTASGEAITTYGLRRVHLQGRGLSFEVSSVIEDVVTPLLGLEIMIQHSLSLTVEHDFQHYLVNPAGDKTKLEHIGRHLDMIACPSQQGLSPCVWGSLSHVFGFLPADKDLHEQRLTSSLAIDEDTNQSYGEQDSLSLLCQYVSLHDSHAFSPELVHSTEQAADSGGEPKVSFPPKSLQQPTITAQARKLHNMTPIPRQSGCVMCKEAKVTASQHQQPRASIKTSTIQLAYDHINYPRDQEPSLILLWVESLTGLAGSVLTKERGTTAQQLAAVVTFIHSHGFAHSTLQCDEQPGLVQLLEAIGKHTGLSTSISSVRDQKLHDLKRSLHAQFRALMLDVSQRYKLHPSSFLVNSSLDQYMLRHAVWLLNRFQLHSSDNRTSFQRRWGTAYRSSVLPFGELVLASDQSLALWLGRCEVTDEHVLAKAFSSSLVTSTFVTRMSLESSRDLDMFKSITLPPRELASAAYLKMAELGDQPSEQAGGATELKLEYQPQASTQHPQQKAQGRHEQQPSAMSFPLTPGVVPSPLPQACPYELSDLAWQQPALHYEKELPSTALHPPVVQQLASATTTSNLPFSEPTLRRQPSEEKASPQQRARRSQTQKGPTHHEPQSILDRQSLSRRQSLWSILWKSFSNPNQQRMMLSLELTLMLISICFQQLRSSKLSSQLL